MDVTNVEFVSKLNKHQKDRGENPKTIATESWWQQTLVTFSSKRIFLALNFKNSSKFSSHTCIRILFVCMFVYVFIVVLKLTFSHDECPGVMESHVSYAAIPRHFTEGKILENLVEHGVVHVTASEELFSEGQSDDLAVWNVYKRKEQTKWSKSAV